MKLRGCSGDQQCVDEVGREASDRCEVSFSAADSVYSAAATIEGRNNRCKLREQPQVSWGSPRDQTVEQRRKERLNWSECTVCGGIWLSYTKALIPNSMFTRVQLSVGDSCMSFIVVCRAPPKPAIKTRHCLAVKAVFDGSNAASRR